MNTGDIEGPPRAALNVPHTPAREEAAILLAKELCSILICSKGVGRGVGECVAGVDVACVAVEFAEASVSNIP